MTRWVALLTVAVALGAAGCSKKKSERKEAEPGSTETTSTPARMADKDKPAAPDSLADKARKEARAVLDGWLAAQNKSDFASYKTLYQPHFFRGVKRTTSGVVARLDYKGWLADRGRMFKKPVEVAAEDVEIKTWLDDGAKLKPNVSAIRFTQRWKSGTYADHGIKIMHVWRDAKGTQRIVYEDLVNAERGWSDEVVKSAPLALEAPTTSEGALALWKSLGVTGANYKDKLGAIPEDEAVRGRLARALIAGGNFDCKRFEQYNECGEAYNEWSPLDPKATIDDPCLRRRLAEWALDAISDGFKPGDAAAVAEQLVAMAAVEGPDDDLVAAAIASALALSNEVAVEVIVAASKAGHEAPVNTSIESVDDKALLTALYRASITMAGEPLAEILEADSGELPLLLDIATDDKISTETRASIVASIADIKKKAVGEALHAIAGDNDCSLAMAAAEALAERGDKSALPSHATSTLASASADLCMLLAGDSEHASDEAEKFFTDAGAILTENIIGDDYPDYDEDGNLIEDDDMSETSNDDAEPDRVHQTDFVDLDPFNDDEVTLTFASDKNGKPVLDSVEVTRWIGCGC